VVVAPGRAQRPGAPRPPEESDEDDPAACPFCEGRESETPPEVFAVPSSGRPPDTPGWLVRVAPNKYPVLTGPAGRHEVVVHTPRHARSLAELDADELGLVVDAWRARAAAARDDGFAYAQALVNEGRAAGGSLPHTHSQLVWLREPPPAIVQELGAGACRVCDLLAAERTSGERVVQEHEGLVALCPYAGRAPYELLVAPSECEPDAWGSTRLADGLRLLAQAIGQLRSIEGTAAVNAWLHTSSFGGPALHWHLEALPRLSVFAGLELGAGIYVNPLPPEQAAAALRTA
jgi:UDPglucose--hexose-1-phosphate uridylyltransferase